jgi:hypothetical protein
MQTSGSQATAGVGPRAGSRAGRSLGTWGAVSALGLVLTGVTAEKAEGEVVIGGRPERLD